MGLLGVVGSLDPCYRSRLSQRQLSVCQWVLPFKSLVRSKLPLAGQCGFECLHSFALLAQDLERLL